MALAEFAIPPEERFFEDYDAGNVYEFGAVSITQDDIIDFARTFDPQDFHIDPAKAALGPFKGIIASGWHTIGVVMRVYVDYFLSHVASLGSPGVDEIRWPNPVRPGDTLGIRIEILEARPSHSKADRGVVRVRIESRNQRGELVLSMMAVSLIGRRHGVEVNAP